MEKKIWLYLFHLCTLTIPPIITSQPSNAVLRHSPFEEMTKSENFVDKTYLIEHLHQSWMVRKDLHICKPKGFGKSILLDMLKRFYEINIDATTGQRVQNITSTENYKLFKNETLNLNISRSKTFDKFFGQYVVIYLDFSAPSAPKSYEDVVQFVSACLIKGFEPLAWVLESWPQIDGLDKKLMSNVFSTNATSMEMTRSLNVFSKILRNYFKKPVILLVDEIDRPVNQALLLGLNAKAVNDEIITPLLFNTLKQGEVYVKYSFLTGTNCIAAECLLNNVRTVAFLDDEFAEYCAFTMKETNALFEKHNIKYGDLRKEVINFYNGYKTVTVNARIMNPWSLVRYFSQENFTKPLSHWPANFSFPKLTACFANEKLKIEFFNLILNKRINFPLTKVFDSEKLEILESFLKIEDCTETVDDDLKGLYLSYLFINGYLTYSNNEITFQLPNGEINHEFIMYFKYFYGDYFTMQDSLSVINSLDMIMISPKILSDEIVKLKTNFVKLFKIGFINIDEPYDVDDFELQVHALLYTEIQYLGVFQKVSTNRKDSSILHYNKGDTKCKRNDVTIIDKIRNCILIIELKLQPTAPSRPLLGKKQALQLLEDYKSNYKYSNVDGTFLKFLLVSIHNENYTEIEMGPRFILFRNASWTIVENDEKLSSLGVQVIDDP